MRRHFARQSNHRVAIFFVLIVGLLGAAPLFTSACKPAPTAITIVNNSTGWQFHHLYLSPVDQDKWGPDQLNGTIIGNGGSWTLNNVSCDAASIKVIAEDQNGCFLYQTVSCGESPTWTITNQATPDCGG